MRLLEDSRQQIAHGDKHLNKHRWWEGHGVEVERVKLDFGDYMVEGSNISVDTKRNIQEVAGNLGREHARFVREIERANQAGYLLVVLVETGGKYKAVDDIGQWTSTVCLRCQRRRMGYCNPKMSMGCAAHHGHKPMQGATVVKIMRRLEEKHQVRFEVCHPAHSAQRICDILGVPYE